MEQDVAVILCQTTDRPPSVPSNVEHCCKCDTTIWISHSGKRQAEKSGLPVKPICPVCMLKVPREEREEVDFPSDEIIAQVAQKSGMSEEAVREKLKKLIFGINASNKFESN